MTRLDLAGQKFGRLTAIEIHHVKNGGKTMWHCTCECGGEKITDTYSLRSGKTKSCGCIQKEFARKQGKANAKHGMKGTRLYTIWCSMKQRCYYPKFNGYERYGGRGISICEEWLNFVNFMEWSLKNGYGDNLTIDRIDYDGNYEPSNCRWATQKEQSNNRSNNTFLNIGGVERTISGWSEVSGVSKYTISARLQAGWKVDENLLRKDDPKLIDKELIDNALLFYQKNKISLPKVADKFGIKYGTLYYHYKKGLDMNEPINE